MKQNKINKGALPPLFDRIIDDKTGGGGESQLFNADQLKESIVNELSLILNTRCTVRKVIYEDHLETIPLFGLPDFFGLGDFSYFDGSNSQDWPNIALFVQTAIQAAEPRLEMIHVTVESYDSLNQALSIEVFAHLKNATLIKEIHFPLTLQHWGKPSQKVAA
jgi:type VI secretion system lysozyme-like protein